MATNRRTGSYLLTVSVLFGFISASQAGNRCDTCQRDKQGRIERSVSAKNEFKRDNPCPSTGLPRGSCPGHVIDHITALKHGGADVPCNMQWQTIAEAKAKDQWE